MDRFECDVQAGIQAEFEETLARLAELVARAQAAGFQLVWSKPAVSVGADRLPAELVVATEPEIRIKPPQEPAIDERAAIVERPCADPPGQVVPFVPPREELSEPLRKLVAALLVSRAPAEEIAFLLGFARDSARLDLVMPPRARIEALTFASARMRHLQDAKLAGEADHVRPFMSMVSSYARMARVGAVYGPKRSDRPNSGSWERDAALQLRALAERAGIDVEPPNPGRLIGELERLVSTGGADEDIRGLVERCFDAGIARKDTRLARILTPVLHALDGKRFKEVRSEIRLRLEEENEAEDAAPAARVPEDWPYWHLTRGKRAVIVGGDSREPNRARIQQTFGFASLDWVETQYKDRALHALRERIARGGAEAVIILTAFIGHNADNILLPACRERGIPFIFVHTGYGIVGIRAAIERFGTP